MLFEPAHLQEGSLESRAISGEDDIGPFGSCLHEHQHDEDVFCFNPNPNPPSQSPGVRLCTIRHEPFLRPSRGTLNAACKVCKVCTNRRYDVAISFNPTAGNVSYPLPVFPDGIKIMHTREADGI